MLNQAAGDFSHGLTFPKSSFFAVLPLASNYAAAGSAVLSAGMARTQPLRESRSLIGVSNMT